MKTEDAKVRCNFPDISYLSETQKNNFQFLNKYPKRQHYNFMRVEISFSVEHEKTL